VRWRGVVGPGFFFFSPPNRLVAFISKISLALLGPGAELPTFYFMGKIVAHFPHSLEVRQSASRVSRCDNTA